MKLAEVLQPALKARAEKIAEGLKRRFGEDGIEVVEKDGGYSVVVTNDKSRVEEFGVVGGDATPWVYGLYGSSGSHLPGGDGAGHG